MNEQSLAMVLLHFVWQGAVLAAVAALLFRIAASPQVRYVVGCTLLTAMLCAPIVTALWPGRAPSSAARGRCGR